MRRFLDRATKWIFSTFRRYFRALNATICLSMIHKFFTIEKYGVSAFAGKKINVLRPKLIVNETNKFLKNFQFFKKKMDFFHILRIPWKKTAPGAVFFWKSYSTSKLSKIVSNYFLTFLKVLLESSDFTLNDFETLNATILLYLKSSHLEAKISQF